MKARLELKGSNVFQLGASDSFYHLKIALDPRTYYLTAHNCQIMSSSSSFHLSDQKDLVCILLYQDDKANRKSKILDSSVSADSNTYSER